MSGTFEQGPPTEAEGDDWPEMTRLSFNFNRRNMGRLRQMIDMINRGGGPPTERP